MKRLFSFIAALALSFCLTDLSGEAEAFGISSRFLPLGIQTDGAKLLENSKAVTKSPTGETVEEGGFAQFVARAANCSGVIWHLSSADGTDLLAQNAQISFPGLEVKGLGSERLVLDNIPAGLDNWNVWAEFVYLDGNLISNFATLHVISKNLAPPTILSHPNSVNLDEGQTITLQTAAEAEGQGLSLKYQWFSNTENSSANGQSIPDADESSYTPAYTPGTVYYYCAIRTTDGNSISSAAKTKCAAVSYPTVVTQPAQPPTEPATEPAPAQNTEPVTEPAQDTGEPQNTAATLAAWSPPAETAAQTPPSVTVPPAAAPIRTDTGTNSLMLLIAAVIAVILLITIIAVLVILKAFAPREKPRKNTGAKRQADNDPPVLREEEAEWDDLSDLDLSFYLDDENDL